MYVGGGGAGVAEDFFGLSTNLHPMIKCYKCTKQRSDSTRLSLSVGWENGLKRELKTVSFSP